MELENQTGVSLMSPFLHWWTNFCPSRRPATSSPLQTKQLKKRRRLGFVLLVVQNETFFFRAPNCNKSPWNSTAMIYLEYWHLQLRLSFCQLFCWRYLQKIYAWLVSSVAGEQCPWRNLFFLVGTSKTRCLKTVLIGRLSARNYPKIWSFFFVQKHSKSILEDVIYPKYDFPPNHLRVSIYPGTSQNNEGNYLYGRPPPKKQPGGQ